MVYLLLAITASTLILVSFKVFEKLGIDSFTAITMNYLIGAVFGFNSIHWEIDFFGIYSLPWFPFSALTGLILITGFVLFSLSSQKAGIAITAISSRMAVIISVITGILVFGDKVGIAKSAGVVIAIVGFYLTFRKGKAERPGLFVLLLPLAVFIFMGLNDVILKTTQYYIIGINNEKEMVRYAATSFLFGLLFGFPTLVFRHFRMHKPIQIKSMIAGIFLGLLNWFSTYYLLKGLGVMEVSVFIPLLNISVVTISSLIGYFIFDEKLNAANRVGIALAVVAIFLIAKA
jgi:drug/metabolite transporter (DMT)-like permease